MIEIHNLGLSDFMEKKLATYFESIEEDFPLSGVYHQVIREVERVLIQMVLNQVGGNKLQAARMLGINRNTLHKKIQELCVL
jgi:two-component system nitrogen regulation response regulator GlnG